jgi:hypothetical protein
MYPFVNQSEFIRGTHPPLAALLLVCFLLLYGGRPMEYVVCTSVERPIGQKQEERDHTYAA